MSFKIGKYFSIITTLKINLSLNLFLLILINIQNIHSLIKIPFKITKYQDILNNDVIDEIVKDILFNYKLLSFISIGDPPQSIEASFNLKLSNYFITNYCKNSSTFYSYKESKSFSEINTIENPTDIIDNFYCNETFLFQNSINNNDNEITVNDMLIYIPRRNEEYSTNCINIGLKFPDNINNKYQETFIQQLKHKNIINKYIWTMILYKKDYSSNIDNNYDGEFIFGDILNDYYPKKYNDYSNNKLVYAYTANINKNNEDNKILLEWGILLQIFYEIEENNEKNNIYLNSYIFEFDYTLNGIIGTYEYFQKIQKHYFNTYISKNICKSYFLGRMSYKFIYCNAESFTINDLQKFPSLNFKNKDLGYIFTLTYEDLFLLTQDKKYYIFSVIITNTDDEIEEEKWVLGLPFWRKYQFSFDIDNKLIYFYNKNGKFIDKRTHKTESNEMQPTNDEMENENNDINITNNQRIIKDNKNKKKNNEINMDRLIAVFVLGIFFLFLVCFTICLVKKTLFKKGYVLMRNKKANELEDEYYYSSNNIDFNKEKADLNKKELEMQIKSGK